MSRRIQRGFTLVELLVVIGIIAVLVGILLPVLSKARQQAYKTQDLNNCRQMVLAVVSYSTSFKGYYPYGSRMVTASYGWDDDLDYMAANTFDYFLQYINNKSGAVATQMATYPTWKNGLSCNAALMGNNANASMFSTTYYAGYYREMMAGWIYFGQRFKSWPGTTLPNSYIVDESGNWDSVNKPIYKFPYKAGDHPTTRTLITCFAYNYTGGTSSWLPHLRGGSYIEGSTKSTSNMTDLKTRFEGMCVGCTDGSARFVPSYELGQIRYDGAGSTMYFYDSKAN